ncbi:MAG: chlorophyll synthesis pathway protein BchC [Burkholderiaceae bacterium]|nr:chlorophyll synthesis pathway protein BchC [Burkholderiaceae bacterium]
MDSVAVVLQEPGHLGLAPVALRAVQDDDLIVQTRFSAISTGTERLLFEGRMPHFPGMGYPLVPGYEAVGTVVDAGRLAADRIGQTVFVPGATCYREVRALFGAAAARLLVPGGRALQVDADWGEQATLLALAATAHHALGAGALALPELIVGHGVLGRLLARLTLALGAAAPTVWERDVQRRGGALGYEVIDPAADARRDYRVIVDASGDATLLDALIAHLAPGGEIVLAGFYSAPLSFAFAPAFLREARLRIAAQWQPADLQAVRALVAEGRLSLAGLVTHRAAAADAPQAYRTAFDDPRCLKMVLDWRGLA